MLESQGTSARTSAGDIAFAHVRLFGPLSITVGDVVLGPREFGGIKPKQILEILLLERGRTVSKDRLANWVWGESLPRNVTATLETYVSNIRAAFGRDRIGHRLVVTERDAYRIEPSLCEIDLDVFDRTLATRHASPALAATLESALAIARGEVLEDEPWSEWAEVPRERYRRETMRARLDLAELLLAERDFGAAALHAELGMATEALDERAVRLTMVARYAMGRQGEALDAYRRCRGVLAKEIGLEPTAETKALETAILRQEPVENLLPAGTRAGTPTRPSRGARSSLELHLGPGGDPAEVAELALAGALALAHVGGGETAVVRLLEDAARLLEALEGGADRERALADLRGLIARGRRLDSGEV